MIQALTPTPRSFVTFGTLLVLIVSLLWSFYGTFPPRAVLASAPADEFSAERASKHVEEISRYPHPVGSQGHDYVREYLVKTLLAFGVQTEVQQMFQPFREYFGEQVWVQNVVARYPGKSSQDAILLLCHYDSVQNSYGANDDGTGVATLLETLRALKQIPPLENDVIFLFTDGEEIDLSGAKAFVHNHPWAKSVRLVLNFEARGSSGVSNMFETSEESGLLISAFAESVPYPVATSLSYEVYRRLPNDTDFTVFRKAGYAGLNFAYIDGLFDYHTQNDHFRYLNLNSLQHHGDSALALVKHFGNRSLAVLKAPNRIYFSLYPFGFFSYEDSWRWLFSGVSFLLYGLFCFYCFKKKRTTWFNWIKSFLLNLFFLVLVPVLSYFTFRLLEKWYAGESERLLFYSSKWVLSAFSCLVATLTFAWISFIKKRYSLETWGMTIFLFWQVPNISFPIWLVGASYLFTWPLLWAQISLFWRIKETSEGVSWQKQIGLVLGFSVAIFFWVPVLYALFIAMSLMSLPVVLAGEILLLLFLAPLFWSFSQTFFKGIVCFLFGITVLLFWYVLNLGPFDTRFPQTSDLSYVFDADQGKAFWRSMMKKNEWTKHFFQTTENETPPFFSDSLQQSVLSEIPVLEEIKREKNATEQVITFRLHAPKQPFLSYHFEFNQMMFLQKLDSQKIEHSFPTRTLYFYGCPQDGFSFVVSTNSFDPINIQVKFRYEGLPDFKVSSLPERPSSMRPIRFSDYIQIQKTFHFE